MLDEINRIFSDIGPQLRQNVIKISTKKRTSAEMQEEIIWHECFRK